MILLAFRRLASAQVREVFFEAFRWALASLLPDFPSFSFFTFVAMIDAIACSSCATSLWQDREYQDMFIRQA